MTQRTSTGYIGPGLTLGGRLSGDGDMEIDGRFSGGIELSGTVVVGSTGRVDAPVTCAAVRVAGEVRGDVSAASVVVLEGGRIDGDVRAARVAIDDGGLLRGGVFMDFALPETDAGPEGEA